MIRQVNVDGYTLGYVSDSSKSYLVLLVSKCSCIYDWLCYFFLLIYFLSLFRINPKMKKRERKKRKEERKEKGSIPQKRERALLIIQELKVKSGDCQ